MKCVAAEDGVVHQGHFFSPFEDGELEACGGISSMISNQDTVEQSYLEEYKLAMWVTHDGIRRLHKTAVAENLDQAKEWLEEFNEDFRPGIWFIIKDFTYMNSIIL